MISLALEPSFAWKLNFLYETFKASGEQRVLLSSLIKVWGKSVKGFRGYDRTYKQTNRDYYYIYILVWKNWCNSISHKMFHFKLNWIWIVFKFYFNSISFQLFYTFLSIYSIYSLSVGVLFKQIKSFFACFMGFHFYLSP